MVLTREVATTTAERSFDEFVAARGRALGRTAYLLTGDHHLAEDLLQTALMQTARHWERIHGSPEAYARRILYHQNISWWRRKRWQESPLLDHDSPAPAADPDLRVTLEEALRRLTVRQRTILVLRYFEDLTEAQTAAELGISLGAVKSMTRQALGRLRTLAPELAELIGSSDSA
ncbi:SigE family RNA polymerase sigma factor [Nocardioides sp.]|uniref:SigE family RNA polymerase sigma factor n=1 Tax=Nocardioides sp. TaxID=35761 RepID=UPI0035270C82